jgi:hypothetical protein
MVKRRVRRLSPMQRHRFVEALVTGGRSRVAFPGTAMPEPEGARERFVSGGASLLLHGALVLALVLAASLATEEVEEKIMDFVPLPEQAKQEEPAPRPRAIAESMARFDPKPMAVAPQIVNPTVHQLRAPDVQAPQLQLADLAPVQAPREIAIAAPEVPQVRAFQSPVAATTSPIKIDPNAPKLSGPVDFQAPTGTLAGPRQVVTGGSTVGVADPRALGTGSSVREGIASDRDVHGAKTGERASVNVAVGPGGGRGTGGEGTGPGGLSYDECMALPEVKAYLARLHDRVLARWRATPAGLPNGTFRVALSFRLDPSGSAGEIDFRGGAASDAVGRSAVEAMRAASPFDPMTGKVRCLAGNRFNATFILETLDVAD